MHNLEPVVPLHCLQKSFSISCKSRRVSVKTPSKIPGDSPAGEAKNAHLGFHRLKCDLVCNSFHAARWKMWRRNMKAVFRWKSDCRVISHLHHNKKMQRTEHICQRRDKRKKLGSSCLFLPPHHLCPCAICLLNFPACFIRENRPRHIHNNRELFWKNLVVAFFIYRSMNRVLGAPRRQLLSMKIL